jgi:hypothetical protein
LFIFGGLRAGPWVVRWAGSRGWGRGPVTEELAAGGVNDPYVQVLDEQDDAGSGVGSSGADVVQSGVVPQGDRAGLVDAVGPDPVVGLGSVVGLAGAWGMEL